MPRNARGHHWVDDLKPEWYAIDILYAAVCTCYLVSIESMLDAL